MRRLQYQEGHHVPDVEVKELPDHWFEVKTVERLNVAGAWAEAAEQAGAAAALDGTMAYKVVLVHQRSRGPRLATLPATELLRLLRRASGGLEGSAMARDEGGLPGSGLGVFGNGYPG